MALLRTAITPAASAAADLMSAAWWPAIMAPSRTSITQVTSLALYVSAVWWGTTITTAPSPIAITPAASAVTMMSAVLWVAIMALSPIATASAAPTPPILSAAWWVTMKAPLPTATTTVRFAASMPSILTGALLPMFLIRPPISLRAARWHICCRAIRPNRSGDRSSVLTIIPSSAVSPFTMATIHVQMMQ